MILDSSVITAISFEEDASMKALDAAVKFDLIAQNIAIVGVGNVARRQVAFCSADKDKTLAALKKCESFISEACELIQGGGSDLEATSRTRVKDIHPL